MAAYSSWETSNGFNLDNKHTFVQIYLIFLKASNEERERLMRDLPIYFHSYTNTDPRMAMDPYDVNRGREFDFNHGRPGCVCFTLQLCSNTHTHIQRERERERWKHNWQGLCLHCVCEGFTVPALRHHRRGSHTTQLAHFQAKRSLYQNHSQTQIEVVCGTEYAFAYLMVFHCSSFCP